MKQTFARLLLLVVLFHFGYHLMGQSTDHPIEYWFWPDSNLDFKMYHDDGRMEDFLTLQK